MYAQRNFLLFALLLLALTSCSETPKKEVKTTTKHSTQDKQQKDTLTLVEEEFIDSLSIGIKGHNKLEVRKFRTTDSVYVTIRFFEKSKKGWQQIQQLQYPKDGITSCDVMVSDFNNDGCADFTFQSSIAARGANEIRQLVIFDKTSGKLISIRNSESFPNIRYNKIVDCIDGFRVYAGSQTAFGRVVGDSLVEFANVEVFENRIIVNKIDRNGTTKTIKDEKFDGGSYVRFENFAPLQELKEEY